MAKKKVWSHYDSRGRVRMVDVSAKPKTARVARAYGFIRVQKKVLREILRMKNPKGNSLEIARIAGIAAAKKTAELIPLCHPLPLTHINVDCQARSNGIAIESTVKCMGETGVEMEALTAVAVAALTIYDMCKALDRSMTISEIYLLEKSGGRSGTYRARRR